MAALFTSTYAVAPGKYLGAIAYDMLGKLWWLLLIPLIFFIAGVADWRWAVIGLMMLFLVYPALMTIALLSHGMRIEVIRRSSSRLASVDGNKITLYREIITGDIKDYQPVETSEIVETYSRKDLTKIIIRSEGVDSPGFYDFVLIPTESYQMINPR